MLKAQLDLYRAQRQRELQDRNRAAIALQRDRDAEVLRRRAQQRAAAQIRAQTQMVAREEVKTNAQRVAEEAARLRKEAREERAQEARAELKSRERARIADANDFFSNAPPLRGEGLGAYRLPAPLGGFFTPPMPQRRMITPEPKKYRIAKRR